MIANSLLPDGPVSGTAMVLFGGTVTVSGVALGVALGEAVLDGVAVDECVLVLVGVGVAGATAGWALAVIVTWAGWDELLVRITLEPGRLAATTASPVSAVTGVR